MLFKKICEELGEGEFRAYLQPKHDVNTGKVCGAECLSRFVSGEGLAVMPFEYIQKLEDNGLIKELDFYMLEQVCEILSDWKLYFSDTEAVPVSVNFSKKTMQSDGFLERFNSIIDKYSVNPELVEVEITELHMFHDYALAREVIDSIRKKGCSVSVDDYGKNSSAFSIIRQVDVDVLKIDREVIVESEKSLKAFIIFESVVELAKKLKLLVVAEGVETEQQLELAKKVKCDEVQGWYYSKALSVEDFAEYMMSYNRI